MKLIRPRPSRLLRTCLRSSVAFLAMLLLVPTSAFAQATDVFISEYIEGSSNNKAIEIYNGTSGAVDLAAGQYQLEYYFNGAGTPALTIVLSGTVTAGDVYVVAHGSANATILAAADQTNSSGWFNGDDAIVLRKSGAAGPIVDSVGQLGTDPGTEWGTGLLSTADNTLRRLPGICAGDTTAGDAFDPALQWDGFALDTAGGLGAHTANCALPNLTINDISVVEGDAGTQLATFTVSLDGPAGPGGVTFDITTADDSAVSTGNADFVAQNLTGQSIASGNNSYAFSVTINGDTIYEFDEQYFVNVGNVVGATVSDGQGTGAITLDDSEPTLTATVTPSSAISEGNAGTTPVNITYELSGAAQDDLTINLHTVAGSADAADFNGFAMGDSVSIPGGNLSVVYSDVTINGDTAVEPNETFDVTVDDYFFGGGRRAPNGVVLPNTTVTIVNDDVAPMPAFTINDVTVTETDAAGVIATFTVTLANAMPPPRAPNGDPIATVAYTTVDGSALQPADYTLTSGTLNFFAVGTQTINVPIEGDLIDEASENFTIVLSGATGATISDDTGLGTIDDNDAPPTLSIDDVSRQEGDAGSVNAMLWVALSTESEQTVTVTATTVDGTATTADNDYAATTTSVTFMPFETGKFVAVPINGDTTEEPDETFFVNLSDAVNASILDGQAQGTILNDEAPTTADLNVTVTASPDPVSAGGQITYVVTVTNTGPGTAFGVHMDLPLPAGTTFVSETNNGSWICSTPGVGAHGTVFCGPVFSNLPIGTVQFTIVVSVNANVAGGTELSATATATTTTTDPTPNNNSGTGSTTVLGPVFEPSVPVPALDRFAQLLMALLVLGFAAVSLRRASV
jgi:uncharacterized repeat protein (TIGR01451 family)